MCKQWPAMLAHTTLLVACTPPWQKMFHSSTPPTLDRTVPANNIIYCGFVQIMRGRADIQLNLAKLLKFFIKIQFPGYMVHYITCATKAVPNSVSQDQYNISS